MATTQVCRHSTPLGRATALQRLVRMTAITARRRVRLFEAGRYNEASVMFSLALLVQGRAHQLSEHLVAPLPNFAPFARMGQYEAYHEDLAIVRGWRQRYPHLLGKTSR